MKREILHIIALDNKNLIVNANNALKGETYFCPSCKSELILKKSGKTGVGSRRPHFAHKSLTVNCTPESVLHYSFKKMLLEKIDNNLINNIPMNIILTCNYCHSIIPVNLLTKNCTVKDEYDMKICRPDIALLDEKGIVYVVFEIVVTHKPEENVVKYYQNNNILLIQINLFTEHDLENIEETIIKNSIIITRPDYFNICINKNCISKRKIYRRVSNRSRRF